MAKQSQWLASLPLVVNWNGNDKTNIISLADSCTSQLSHLSFFPKSFQCIITSSHISLCSNLSTAHVLFSVPSQITLFRSTFVCVCVCERFLFVKLFKILWLFWFKMEKLVELFKIPGERKTIHLTVPSSLHCANTYVGKCPLNSVELLLDKNPYWNSHAYMFMGPWT